MANSFTLFFKLITAFLILTVFPATLSPVPVYGETIAEKPVSIPDNNRIFQDNRTGLEWMAGPDRDTSWNEAGSWVDGLHTDRDAWRMPDLKELREIFRDTERLRNLLSLFKSADCWIWSGKTKSLKYAWFVLPDNSGGGIGWIKRTLSIKGRAVAVRSIP